MTTATIKALTISALPPLAEQPYGDDMTTSFQIWPDDDDEAGRLWVTMPYSILRKLNKIVSASRPANPQVPTNDEVIAAALYYEYDFVPVDHGHGPIYYLLP